MPATEVAAFASVAPSDEVAIAGPVAVDCLVFVVDAAASTTSAVLPVETAAEPYQWAAVAAVPSVAVVVAAPPSASTSDSSVSSCLVLISTSLGHGFRL